MFSLTYISQASIDPRDRATALDDIMTVAVARNTMLDITGLLIISPGHFAQILEGPMLAVETVMASIKADPRHTALRIVRQSSIEKTCFPHWRMARLDSDNFGATTIAPLLMAAHAEGDPKAVDRLDRLIELVATDLLLCRKPLPGY